MVRTRSFFSRNDKINPLVEELENTSLEPEREKLQEQIKKLKQIGRFDESVVPERHLFSGLVYCMMFLMFFCTWAFPMITLRKTLNDTSEKKLFIFLTFPIAQAIGCALFRSFGDKHGRKLFTIHFTILPAIVTFLSSLGEPSTTTSVLFLALAGLVSGSIGPMYAWVADSHPERPFSAWYSLDFTAVIAMALAVGVGGVIDQIAAPEYKTIRMFSSVLLAVGSLLCVFLLSDPHTHRARASQTPAMSTKDTMGCLSSKHLTHGLWVAMYAVMPIAVLANLPADYTDHVLVLAVGPIVALCVAYLAPMYWARYESHGKVAIHGSLLALLGSVCMMGGSNPTLMIASTTLVIAGASAALGANTSNAASRVPSRGRATAFSTLWSLRLVGMGFAFAIGAFVCSDEDLYPMIVMGALGIVACAHSIMLASHLE